MRRATRLRIEGRVQGVGYRAWAAEAAYELGLDGWVRNRADGSVELLAIGHEAALEALTRRCAEGPPLARVTQVQRSEAEDDGARGFAQRATA